MSKNEINDAMTISEAFKDVTQTFEMMSETIRSSAFFKLTVDVSGIIGAIAGIIQLQKNIEDIAPDVGNVFEKLETELENSNNSTSKVISKLSQQLGRDIANGISEGLKDGINVVKMATTVICNDGILETVKDELQIKSPSKVMKRLGEYISEGLGDGIKDGGKHIKAAMGDATDIIEDSSKRMSKLQFGLGGLAAVTAIVVPLIDYFVNMMSTNETLSAKMEEIWVKICEAFKPVTDAVINLFNQFTAGSESSVSALDNLLAAIGVAAEILAGVVESIAGFFREYGDEIMVVVGSVWEYIGGIVAGAIDVFGGVFDIIVGIFTGNGEKIKEGFKGIFEGVTGIFGGLIGFFSDLWANIKDVFTSIGSTIGNGIGNAFKTVVNAVIGFAEGTINKFIKAINGAIGMINLIPGVSIKMLPTLSIPRLASGGLVSPGQLFVAREAGPELVGNFGARTGVMNNNQIVESVSRGVYSAVKEAMGSGSPITLNINNQLDGRSIGKQVIKYHNGVVKQTGLSPLLI